jgi:zinc transport system substrate-binding protein
MKNNKLKFFVAISLVLITGLGYVIWKKNNTTQVSSIIVGGSAQNTEPKKIKVAASFYPLADFTKNIGGDLVEVINITPAGTEPHDFEPSAKDISQIYNSDLLVFNGNGVDNWAEKISPDIKSKGIEVLKMSDHLDSLVKNFEDKEGGQYDPHFWLDPVNVQTETRQIAEALVKIDPMHKDEYNKNTINFLNKLQELDAEYKNGLSICSLKTIVTSHNAFNYLAARYGLNTMYILGLSPEEEPSAQTIAQVAKDAKNKGIKYIFFETLVSPKLSETIAKEIGAKTLELNPIEGLNQDDIAAGKNYISEMKQNLNNLRLALECQ